MDISGNLALRERELHRWQPSESTNNLALDEATPGSQGQGWNQFEANERLFGLKSDYYEDIYTTKLDRAHPLYQQREAAAAKIAREIEGQSISANMNPHVAEERNITFGDDSGVDEEDRYIYFLSLVKGTARILTFEIDMALSSVLLCLVVSPKLRPITHVTRLLLCEHLLDAQRFLVLLTILLLSPPN